MCGLYRLWVFPTFELTFGMGSSKVLYQILDVLCNHHASVQFFPPFFGGCHHPTQRDRVMQGIGSSTLLLLAVVYRPNVGTVETRG